MIKLDSVPSHAWGSLVAPVNRPLAAATVCFPLEVIPKSLSANFKMEWTVVLTGYHQTKKARRL